MHLDYNLSNDSFNSSCFNKLIELALDRELDDCRHSVEMIDANSNRNLIDLRTHFESQD